MQAQKLITCSRKEGEKRGLRRSLLYGLGRLLESEFKYKKDISIIFENSEHYDLSSQTVNRYWSHFRFYGRNKLTCRLHRILNKVNLRTNIYSESIH